MKSTRWTAQLAGAALFLSFATACGAASEMQHVVILYDERTDLPGLAVLDRRLRDTLTSGASGALEIYREAMDLSRFGSDDYLAWFRDYLAAKYRDKQIDVVIGVMGPAFDFLVRNSADVFPGASLVFCGIDRRELNGRTLPPYVTGVILKREFAPTLELVLKLHPDAQRVILAAGASEFDARLVQQAKEEFARYEARVELVYLTDLAFPALLRELSQLPPHSIVLYSTLFRDGAGEAFVPHEAAEQISASANAPVYGFLDQYLGRGIVGGHLYSLSAHGEQAARLALQLLAGVPAAELPPIEHAAGRTAFDARQLERWNISESSLPADATVEFREPSLWGQYKRHVVAATTIVCLQFLLIGGLVLQIARRRRSEARLRESEMRFRTAADSAPVMIWLTSAEQADEFFNQCWLRFAGASSEKSISEWTSRLHAADAPRILEIVHTAFVAREPFESECRLRRADGEYRWIHCTGAPRYAADGVFLGFIYSAIDIEERRQAEDATRSLTHASRLAMVGELTAMVAHEIRQPLSAIHTNAETGVMLLTSSRPSQKDLHAILADIRDDSLRANAAIRRIRDLVSKHDVTLSPLDLNGCVQEVLRLTAYDARRRGVSIEKRLDRGLPLVVADRTHVQQVVLNLIVNAMDAMRDTESTSRLLTVHTSARKESEAEVAVSDCGHGIPPSDLENVFESFFTTKRDGMGLGLRIARSIVESHNGRIWAENNAEGGATFRFTLKLASPIDAADASVAAPSTIFGLDEQSHHEPPSRPSSSLAS